MSEPVRQSMSEPVRQGETIASRTFGPFDAAAVVAYARASADDNPLHVDAALAARAGLERPPIHGMLIVGCFEAYLDGWRPDLVVERIACKFIRPVLVGEGVAIGGKVVQAVPGSPAVVRLVVKRAGGSGDIVCMAEAFVRASEDPVRAASGVEAATPS